MESNVWLTQMNLNLYFFPLYKYIRLTHLIEGLTIKWQLTMTITLYFSLSFTVLSVSLFYKISADIFYCRKLYLTFQTIWLTIGINWQTSDMMATLQNFILSFLAWDGLLAVPCIHFIPVLTLSDWLLFPPLRRFIQFFVLPHWRQWGK